MRCSRPSSSGSPESRRGGVRLAGAALLSLAAAGSGCANPPEQGVVVNDSVYVAVMTRLLLVKDSMVSVNLPYWSQQQTLDSVEKVIAAEEGVTADDLFEFARTAGRDPTRMRSLWELVRQRVDSLRPPKDEEEEGSETERAPPRDPASRRRPTG